MKNRFAPADDPRILLGVICRMLHTLTKGLAPMTWVDLRKIEDRLGVGGSSMRPALELGMAKKWLMTEGTPALRVALRDAGATSLSRVEERRARAA
jgi:hypothetical protein